MKQYLDLLQNILDNGVEKESGRANMPNTFGISHGVIRMDLDKGFPLLTTKKMYLKGIIHELLWFLRGETNIKYLVDNNVNIWNGDAYRWYLKKYHERAGWSGDFPAGEELSMEGFIDLIKNPRCNDKPELPYWTENTGERYTLGDLGKVYGHQWRNQNGVDQIKEVLDGLKSNPYSRYHIIDAWNKADFKDMALPPCHLLYQFIVRPLSVEDRWDLFQKVEWNEPLNQKSADDKELHRICDEHNIPKFYLDLNMYQRSCDTFLGVPFNIASMSLLLHIFAKASNMVPGVSTWIGGDTHLYVDHIPVVREQLSREPYTLPELKINKELKTLGDVLELTIDDFQLNFYTHQGVLKGELFTGLKK